jgi:hypothetical protein
VNIVSHEKIAVSTRMIYKVNGVNTSFSELMALPSHQLDTTYWLPWYNNVDLDTQLRIANVSDADATVHISIGGQEVEQSPLSIAAGTSTRLRLTGVNGGPVKIESDQLIVAAERVIYKVNGLNTSFSEMMAVPGNQLGSSYYFPWYNNRDLDTQLRIASASEDAIATVAVYIAGVEMPGSPFALYPGESVRMSFPGVNNGPVQVFGDRSIVAAERVIYKVNGVNTSFSEMIGLTDTEVNTLFWLPWYNNVDLDTQLRIGTR